MWGELFFGARRTIEIALASWGIGLPLGVGLALFGQLFSPIRQALRTAAATVVIVPFLAILFWVHYPLQSYFGVVWPPLFTTVVLLSAFVTLSVGDVLSGELTKLDNEFSDAAVVLGISTRDFVWRVLFRGAVERSLSRLLSVAITSVHLTMFGSLIGVEELFRVTQRLNAQLLRPIELYSAMAVFYAGSCLPLYFFAAYLERRLKGSNAER